MDSDNIYDIFIIGGGINGAGIANYISQAGLKIYLCEKKDFGGATSSNSTKLIHGGLRYLENYQFNLVRAALLEREDLQKIAPHIIYPLNFILLHNPNIRNKWLVRLGLFIYDCLAGFKNKFNKTKVINIDAKTELNNKYIKYLDVKNINQKKITAFVYTDLWVSDSRLVLLNILAAKNNGASVNKNTECINIKYNASEKLWDITLYNTKLKTQQKIHSKVIINSAGPWVNYVLNNIMNIKPNYDINLVKGSHIIVDKLYNGEDCYVVQNSDARIVFFIPYENNYTLIGTTEEEYNPTEIDKKPNISQNEMNYLIQTSNKIFKNKITQNSVVYTYSGIRPLLSDNNNNLSKNTRDYLIELNKSINLVNIYGGKLTTYRKLARDVINKLIKNKIIKVNDIDYNKILPGGNITNNLEGCNLHSELNYKDYKKYSRAQDNYISYLKQKYINIDHELLTRYATTYGSLSETILANVSDMSELGISFGANLYQKEVDYLINYEFADSVDDIIWRRTKLSLALSPKEIDSLNNYIISQNNTLL